MLCNLIHSVFYLSWIFCQLIKILYVSKMNNCMYHFEGKEWKFKFLIYISLKTRGKMVLKTAPSSHQTKCHTLQDILSNFPLGCICLYPSAKLFTHCNRESIVLGFFSLANQIIWILPKIEVPNTPRQLVRVFELGSQTSLMVQNQMLAIRC